MISSRFESVKRCCTASAVAVAVLAAAAPASARNAYVANSGDETVSAIDAGTNAPIGTIAVGKAPVDVAITPDGSRAYVANMGDGTVSVIGTATNGVIATIPVGTEPRGVAVTPNGQLVYVGNAGDDTVSVIGTATNAVVGAPIPVGGEPDGVAISPDGQLAFVAQRAGDVSIIATSTNTVVGSVPDALGPSRIAVGPRGGRAFVTNSGSSSVTAFNPANGSVVGEPIAVGKEPAGIAIESSGAFAYAASPADGTLTPINTALDTPVGGPLPFPGATGVALKPDGLQGYVTDGGGGSVSILDTTRNAAVGSIPVGGAPAGVAVVPNQGPVASFWVSPARKRAKKRLTFHAGGSTDPDGRVAHYAWDFGDRRRADGPQAMRVHRYRRPGTYAVTLVVTDDEGCSTEVVYTGQTASCNGSAAAATTALIEVVDPTGPALRLAGGKRQRLRGRVNVFARCPHEACALRARGHAVTVFERRRSKLRQRKRLGKAKRLGLTRSWRRLAVPVPKRTRRAVRRALKRDGTAKARLTVIARDESGDPTVRTRKVKFVLPRRRR